MRGVYGEPCPAPNRRLARLVPFFRCGRKRVYCADTCIRCGERRRSCSSASQRSLQRLRGRPCSSLSRSHRGRSSSRRRRARRSRTSWRTRHGSAQAQPSCTKALAPVFIPRRPTRTKASTASTRWWRRRSGTCPTWTTDLHCARRDGHSGNRSGPVVAAACSPARQDRRVGSHTTGGRPRRRRLLDRGRGSRIDAARAGRPALPHV